MKNDLLEKIDVGGCAFLALALYVLPMVFQQKAETYPNFKTVDYWHRYFADLPRFTGLYCGSKEDWNFISVWKSLSKRRRETNFS